MPVRFCPSPGSYAVIRMDPVAMVEHLRDTVALNAAQAVQVKTYLAYVELDLALPFPGKPWYSFSISILSTAPPKADEVRGTTPEMCLTIAPNEWRHPLGRQPLHTDPPFPFPNCYHCPFWEVGVRVRARKDGFNTGSAFKLPPEERVMKNAYFSIDITKSEAAQQKRQLELSVMYNQGSVADEAQAANATALSSTRDPVNDRSELVPQTVSAASSVQSEHRNGSSMGTGAEEEPERAGSDASSLQSSVSQADTVEGILDLGVFGVPSQNPELLPLVDLWLDLNGHITAEEIPDPMDFYKECHEVSRIIHEARARDPTLPQLDLSAFGPPRPKSPMSISSASYTSSEGTSENDDTQGPALKQKPRKFRPFKLIRRLRTRIQYIFRLPYIPVWP